MAKRQEKTYDFVVIGGGSAGYAAARTAAAEGLSTALVDGAEELGGLCILRGCMPSKAIIESANRFLVLREAADFGLHAQNLGSSMAKIRERKRQIIGEFAAYRQSQLQEGNFDLLRGWAQFRDAHTLTIALRDGSTTTLHARTALIATGSIISPPPLPALTTVGYITSDEVLECRERPPSLIVLGGGAIALEMAHFYSALGTEVTIIQRSPQILKEMDEDIALSLQNALQRRGVTFYTETQLRHAERVGTEKILHFLHEGSEKTVRAHEILVALGREPNLHHLKTSSLGLFDETKKRHFIETTSTQQTAIPHLFAAGDVCGPHEIVHLAISQGEIAARNAARLLRGEGRLEEMDYRLKLMAIFTEPQVATVGVSEREAHASGIAYRTAHYPFDDHGKSIISSASDGFVKLIVDTQKAGEIIGAAVVGPEGAELIHEIVVAMHFRATATDLSRIPHYHPTLSEIWTYPAEELAELED